jgi:hypothetical protein
MKKLGILIFIIALFIGVTLASVFSIGGFALKSFSFSVFSGVKGSGNIKTEQREVSEFKSVKVGGAIVVEITAQKDYSLEIEGDDNILPLITTEVDGDTLKIRSEKGYSTSNPIKVRISAQNIDDLDLSGASKVSIVNLDNESLNVDTSGASKISCEGKTKNLTVDMSGASHFDSEKLSADSVSVDASGASKANVSVKDSLKADLSGASKVVYYGNPTNFENKTSGASSIVGK